MTRIGCDPSLFPVIGQREGCTCDNRPDLNMCENCGAACAAMLCAWTTGVLWMPDTIHDILRGEDYLGGLTNVDLETFLRMVCAILTTQYCPAGDAELLIQYRAYLGDACPLLVYRWGDHAGADPLTPIEARVGHWVVVIGLESDGDAVSAVQFADPWDAAIKTESWADHLDWLGLCSTRTYLIAGVERLRAITLRQTA